MSRSYFINKIAIKREWNIVFNLLFSFIYHILQIVSDSSTMQCARGSYDKSRMHFFIDPVIPRTASIILLLKQSSLYYHCTHYDTKFNRLVLTFCLLNARSRPLQSFVTRRVYFFVLEGWCLVMKNILRTYPCFLCCHNFLPLCWWKRHLPKLTLKKKERGNEMCPRENQIKSALRKIVETNCDKILVRFA